MQTYISHYQRCKKELPNLSLMTSLWITKLGCQHSTCYPCPWPWSWTTWSSFWSQSDVHLLRSTSWTMSTSVTHLVFVRLKPKSFNTLLHHLLSPATFTLVDLLAYYWWQRLHLNCYIFYFWYCFLTKFNPDDLCVPSTISVHVHAFFSIWVLTLLLFSIVGFHIYCGCPSVAIASLYFTSVISNNNNNNSNHEY